jgi:putative membrane protein
MTPFLVHWLLASVALVLTAHFVPGFRIEGFGAALVAAVVIGLVNTFIWPVLVLLTLPLTLFTFGFFLLVVNAVSLKIAAGLTPGFSIIGFFPAFIGSVVLTCIGWLVRYVVFGGYAVQ